MPSKNTPFTPLVDPISPPPQPSAYPALEMSGLGWSRRVLPPGPKGLLRRPFIAISGLRRHPQYKRGRLRKEEPSSRRGTAAKFQQRLSDRAAVNHVGTLVNKSDSERLPYNPPPDH